LLIRIVAGASLIIDGITRLHGDQPVLPLIAGIVIAGSLTILSFLTLSVFKDRRTTPSTVLAKSQYAPPSASKSQDKYSVRVPGGLSFSEFKGFEDWSVVAVSQNGPNISPILGNPTVIEAFEAGIPENGKPFPEGSKMAKLHWIATKDVTETGGPLVPSGLREIEFMLKDSKRFTDSHGWGYGDFHFEASSNSWRPGDLQDKPPQANDAKCGAACHESVPDRNYVFTHYGPR
jgi:hypothetical protein